MKNTRAFLVRFLGPTNARPARIKIEDPRFGVSVTIPYSFIITPAFGSELLSQVERYLFYRGIKIVSCAMNKTGFILISNNFRTTLKGK